MYAKLAHVLIIKNKTKKYMKRKVLMFLLLLNAVFASYASSCYIVNDETKDGNRYLQTNYIPFAECASFFYRYTFSLNLSCMVDPDGNISYLIGFDLSSGQRVHYQKGYKVLIKLENDETVVLNSLLDISEGENIHEWDGLLKQSVYHLRPLFGLDDEMVLKLMKNETVKMRIQGDWNFDRKSRKNSYIDLPATTIGSNYFEFRYAFTTVLKTIYDRVYGESVDGNSETVSPELLDGF